MSVGDFCNRDPVIIGESDSIYRAAELIRDNRANCLVVVESRQGKNIPVGIISEHDIVVDVIASRRDLEQETISSVMHEHVLVAYEDDHFFQTIKRMRHHNARYIVVITADGVLFGILSVDDIVERMSELLGDVGCIVTQGQDTGFNQLYMGKN